MSLLFFLILIIFYAGLIGLALYRFIGKGDDSYLLWLILLLFPVYSHIISVTYLVTGSTVLVNILRASKDLVFFMAIISFFLFQKNPFKQVYRLVLLDYLFLLFYGLAFTYLVLPIGESVFMNKALYFKNMSFIGIAYLIGRNSRLNEIQVLKVGKVIIWIAVIAFVVGLGEKIFNTHLHTLTGYAQYQYEINDIAPSGNYGLTWTFEAGDSSKRFGSIFSNPLEYSASMLMLIPIVFFFLVKTRHSNNRYLYFMAMIAVLANVYFAYSRSSMVAVFVVFLFIALHQRYYRFLAIVVFSFMSLIIYVLNFAEEDTKYFFIDTVLFQESSAVGHVVEWFAAIESMSENPMGIGLATSGNASGVNDDTHVGGENQFLIFGVQLGVLGGALYIMMTALVIFQCFSYSRRVVQPNEMFAPFVVSATRFGLLLPMLTANAELYIFVSLTSWFMAGYSMRNIR